MSMDSNTPLNIIDQITLNEAKDFLVNGQPDKALTTIQDIVRFYPNHPEIQKVHQMAVEGIKSRLGNQTPGLGTAGFGGNFQQRTTTTTETTANWQAAAFNTSPQTNYPTQPTPNTTPYQMPYLQPVQPTYPVQQQQPYQGYNQSPVQPSSYYQKPKPSSYLTPQALKKRAYRNIAIFVVIVVVVLGVFFSAFNRSGSSSSFGSSNTASGVDGNGATFTLTAYDSVIVANGNAYAIGIDVKLINTSKATDNAGNPKISDTEYYYQLQEGKVILTSENGLGTSYRSAMNNDGTLAAGQSISGRLVYDCPNVPTSLTLYYTPAGGGETVSVDVPIS